jgi:uncharacterized protein DUF4236
MGLRFQRSIRLGPIKLNLSKFGLGFSTGVRGLRAGVDAKGRRYSSEGVPGTGLSWRTTVTTGERRASGSGTGFMVGIIIAVVLVLLFTVFLMRP